MRETDGPRTDPPSPPPPSREERFGGTSRGYGGAGVPDTYAGPPDTTYAQPPDTTYDGPPLFASSIEEPRRRSGLSVWFAAAFSLVLGIVIGFASGYRAGQGTTGARLTEPATSSPTPTSGASSSGQTFSESDVSDPVRVEPEPIVPTPAKPPVERVPPPTVPAGPRRGPQRAAEPAPQVQSPPDRPAATGPGSLQVVSRPEGAQVFLDGQPVGRTPLSISDVAAGRHTIRLELPGFNGWATAVDVAAGRPIRVAASLEQ